MRSLVAACFLILHSPDGQVLIINAQSIVAMRAASVVPEGHLARGTGTLVYTDNSKVFGVAETMSEIADKANHCEERRS